MTLQFHNTLTRKVEPFQPLKEGRVTLYTCGPTVYDYLHVGNWAAYIYWDTLVRTLMAYGFDVERVMNITDVGHLVSDADDGQDKLEKGAKREGKTAWQIAEFYGDSFLEGMKQLNLLPPRHITKATDYISEQLALVRILKEKGHTYQIDDGIYFDTTTFPTYADFAQLDLAAQRIGERVENTLEKRNPSDFALWKFSPQNEQRDMEWETPADLLDNPGQHVMGFPGWHLECSAMAMNILGKTIDIHTGGIDHIPVHHTNEIAQSESASGKQFSHYWLHNNHLKVNGTKISKSLGNGFTLDDLKKQGYTPLDYRMSVLQGQYRSEGNFTFENLDAAHNRRQHWRDIAALRHQLAVLPSEDGAATDAALNDAEKTVLAALGDDLDTPSALRSIDAIFSKIEQGYVGDGAGFESFFTTIDMLLGLDILSSTPDISTETKELIKQREQARAAKDWVRADELRNQIETTSRIFVRDTPTGTLWSYTK